MSKLDVEKLRSEVIAIRTEIDQLHIMQIKKHSLTPMWEQDATRLEGIQAKLEAMLNLLD